MTLVFAAGNSEQVVMLADRRLTSAGVVVEEDAGKLCSYKIGGASFAVGFAGLAHARGFDTRRWLLSALDESTEPGGIKSFPTLSRFAERATRDFAQLPALRGLSDLAKRAEFLFMGYLNAPDQWVLATALVSNYSTLDGLETPASWDKFAFTMVREQMPRPGEPSFIQWTGMANAVTKPDIAAIDILLRRRKPAQAIIGKATEIMVEAAGRPAAAGTVGTRIVWIRLPANYHEPIETGYYSAQPTCDSYCPDHIVHTPAGSAGFAYMGLLGAEPDRRPIVFPKVHRNAPCPCKSGRRYKNCHGRRSGRPRNAKAPKPSAAKAEGDTPEPSSQ